MGSGYAGRYEGTYGNKVYTEEEVPKEKKKDGGNGIQVRKRTTIGENAMLVKEKYGLDENGMFCESTKRAQIFRSKTPVEDAVEFYKKLGRGGIESDLPNGHGTRTRLSDGTFITYREITSTPGSPAVSINITSPSFIKTQKIHFIMGE